MTFELKKNAKITYKGKVYKVRRVTSSMTEVLAENIISGEVDSLPITSDLKPFVEHSHSDDNYLLIPDEILTNEEEELAKSRLAIIEKNLDEGFTASSLKRAMKAAGATKSTIYRWRAKYIKTRQLTALIDKPGRGGKGKPRLKPSVNRIVTEVIQALTKQKKSNKKIYREIVELCKRENLKPPHYNTVALRISNRSSREKSEATRGKHYTESIFGRKNKKLLQANYPLHIVQVDHTRLDLIIVDEDTRKPYCRPWLTLLIDVFSRMIVGYYISEDAPGNFGTGRAIINSLLTKDKLLANYEIDEQWPCWGPMTILHMDNAGEFHSEMLKAAAFKYGITLKYRMPKKPRYGAHIERLIGTFNKELHDLPGTTFSNAEKRKYYDYESDKFAAFTLKELDEWLVTWITKVYMKKEHKGIGMAPVEKYLMGMNGDRKVAGRGMKIIKDEQALTFDFLPFATRTIQPGGVEMWGIKYFADVMRKWIHFKDPKQKKKDKSPAEFIFKFDPRDISKIWFFDPHVKQYYDVSYYNWSGPEMSLWELKRVKAHLKKNGIKASQEELFKGYNRLKEIEELASTKTKQALKDQQRKRKVKEEKIKANSKSTRDDSAAGVKDSNSAEATQTVKRTKKPFEGLHHEAFK